MAPNAVTRASEAASAGSRADKDDSVLAGLRPEVTRVGERIGPVYMARDCIVCGQPARSGEHVFPAALGGRRTNNGIYCGEHNNRFSPLAAILSEQLRPINSLLAIRPDHSGAPQSFALDAPGGGRFVLSADRIALERPQTVKESAVGASTEITMRFSSQAQLDAWLAEQRAAGKEVNTKARETGRTYFSEPLHIPVSFGGLDGLRAIGYVALTFLAHHFPNEARQSGISKFKDFVQGAVVDHLVWWDSPDSMSGFAPNPFEFGHTVALGVSASRREAYARVSLFSSLAFTAHFGAVETPSDKTTIVYINPQAEGAPDDIREVRENTLRFEASRPSLPTENLAEMIGNGRAAERLQLLLNRISAWNLKRMMRPVLDELNSIRELDEDERRGRVGAIVNREGQRVLNLMLHVVDGLRQQFEADRTKAGLVRSLDALVAADATSSNGLSQSASDALEVAKARLAEEIGKHLSNSDLDLERLSMLLGGGPGAALVGKTIFDQLQFDR